MVTYGSMKLRRSPRRKPSCISTLELIKRRSFIYARQVKRPSVGPDDRSVSQSVSVTVTPALKED